MGIFLVEGVRHGLVNPRSPTVRAAVTGLRRATRDYVLADGVRLLAFVELENMPDVVIDNPD